MNDDLHVVKDNLFAIPVLFRLIQEESQTDWKEMYKVFNMGHRMEFYVPAAHAQTIIDISKGFGVDARKVGYVERANEKRGVTIISDKGRFSYP